MSEARSGFRIASRIAITLAVVTAGLSPVAQAEVLTNEPSPGSPLYVEPHTPTFTEVPASHFHDDSIEWLATAGIASGFSDKTFKPGAVLGDSISGPAFAGNAIVDTLATAGYRSTIRAHGGHRWDQRLDAAVVLAAADEPATHIVINLGTNDAVQIGHGTWTIEQSLIAVDEVLAVFAATPCVHLVTVHASAANSGLTTWAPVLNDAYRSRALADSRVQVLDWDAVVEEHGPENVLSDGVHPNELGTELLAELILDGVQSCGANPPAA